MQPRAGKRYIIHFDPPLAVFPESTYRTIPSARLSPGISHRDLLFIALFFWIAYGLPARFCYNSSLHYGFRPTHYLHRDRQTRQLFTRRPEIISLATSRQRSGPPARAGIWGETVRPGPQIRASHLG